MIGFLSDEMDDTVMITDRTRSVKSEGQKSYPHAKTAPSPLGASAVLLSGLCLGTDGFDHAGDVLPRDVIGAEEGEGVAVFLSDECICVVAVDVHNFRIAQGGVLVFAFL